MRISDWSSDVCSSDLLDRHDKRRPPVRLLKIDENGAEHVVKSVAAADWGDFLRYRYLRFDFSDVRDPGIYVLSFGDTRTAPFRIAHDLYADAWHPTLDAYFPVAMDHRSEERRVGTVGVRMCRSRGSP